jgi:predicted amidohydrolase YtcJ
MKFDLLLLLVCVVSLAGCAVDSDLHSSEEPANVVFLGNHILTVDSETEGANGVAVRGESIVAVGSRKEIEGLIGESTRVVELGDRALLPGFIDAHGHLGMVMQFLDLVNASSPPIGPMQKIDDIVEALRDRIAEREIPAGEFVMGYGYDDSLLDEGRHPNRDDLDRASPDHPIVLLHVSGHLAAANSAALELFEFDAQTPNPPGGVIRRRPGTQEPNGILEETAAIGPLTKLIAGAAKPENFAKDLFQAIAYHARYGITTIQDGASSPAMVAGLRAVAAERPLPIDVAAYVIGNQMAGNDGGLFNIGVHS